MIAVPTIAQLQETMKAVLASLDDTVVASKDSEVGMRQRMLAEAIYGLYNEASAVHDDLFVTDKVSSDALEMHAEARLGSGARKGASIASGIDALRVTGTVGVEIPAGESLSYVDGAEYETTEDATIDSGGSIDVSVASVTTGLAANRDVADVLTFDNPPAGIDAENSLVVAVDGAVDIESDAELIARILDAYRNPPGGGRFSDFRQWSTAVTGVLGAYVYGPSSVDTDGRRGLGTVDVAITKVGTAGARIPTAATQTAVELALDDLRPCTTRDFLVHLPTTVTQNIRVQVEPGPGFEFDWIESVTRTVLSYTAATRLVVLNGTIDPNIAVGDRVLVNGQLAVVETLVASGFHVVEAFAVDPVVSEAVEPGGPLTEPIQTALKAYVDSLGPAKGTAADPEQLDWESRLLLAKIMDVVMGVEGVVNTVILTPGADFTPSDPGGASPPQLVIYGRLRLSVI